MFEFKVMPDDGEPYQVTATTRDIAKWEKTDRNASLARLQADMRASDLYKIAYFAATRQGQYSGSVKEFEESCDLDILDAEEPDPTNAAAQ